MVENQKRKEVELPATVPHYNRNTQAKDPISKGKQYFYYNYIGEVFRNELRMSADFPVVKVGESKIKNDIQQK